MNRQYLEKIRLAELELISAKIAEYFPAQKCSILEVGAGSGWQAKALSEQGHSVNAVDVATSTYSAENIFPVQQYDGAHLPFPNQSFDVVFSSNVLEHVQSLNALLLEMQRVLKDSGVCVHLVPTSQWRIWTSFVHLFTMRIWPNLLE